MSQISICELLKVKEPGDRIHMSMSPNGKWLAFCLNGKIPSQLSTGVSQVVEGTSQWICNLQSGESFQITNKAKSSWGGVWSPVGTTLAFYADINNTAQVWLWTPSNKTVKLAADTLVRPFFGFEKPIWTNNGKCIIVKSMPLKEVDHSSFYSVKNSNEIQSSKNDMLPKVFKTNQEQTAQEVNHNWINRYHSNISIIDIQTGQSNILFHDVFPVGMALSKSGKYLAFTNCLGTQNFHSQQLGYDLWITSIEQKNELVHLEKNIKMEYGLSFSWEQTKDSVIFTTIGPSSEEEVFSIDISSSEKVKCFKVQPPIRLGREYDGPTTLLNGDLLLIVKGRLWRFGKYKREIINEIKIEGRDIVTVMPDSDQANQVIVQTVDKMNAFYGFYKVNYVTGNCMKLFDEPSAHLPWFEGGAVYQNTNKVEMVAFFSQSANEPSSIKLLDVQTQKIRFTSTLSTIDTIKFGESELVFWKRRDRLLRGALLLPKNRIGKVPVIMRVYGGAMQSENIRKFGLSSNLSDNHQLFALKGYAVFLPDLPMDRNSHEPAKEITLAIERALDELVKHPAIDPNRIGIIGHSFGGYSALVAISRIQQFKAAVISGGVGSLISMYTKFDHPNYNYGWIEDGQPNLATTLWENKDRYIQNSPIFELYNIQVPVLIVQGTNDQICKDEAGPIFSSLNRLGKKAEMFLYDEEHWQGTWSEKNLVDYYNRVLQWFDTYV